MEQTLCFALGCKRFLRKRVEQFRFEEPELFFVNHSEQFFESELFMFRNGSSQRNSFATVFLKHEFDQNYSQKSIFENCSIS